MRRASVVALAAVALGLSLAPGALAAPAEGIHKIQHVVVIMQENRTFDHYFGTYPGANGIPSGVCVPGPAQRRLRRAVPRAGRQELRRPARRERLRRRHQRRPDERVRCSRGEWIEMPRDEPELQPVHGKLEGGQCIDAMGYHDAREIPNYWAYAQNFVLQDAMFEPNSSWSWPQHLFQVSGWSATVHGLHERRDMHEQPQRTTKPRSAEPCAQVAAVDGHHVSAAQRTV